MIRDIGNSEIDRFKFIDLLDWLVMVVNHPLDYTISDNCVYLLEMEEWRVISMFLFDQKTHYCYLFDSYYLGSVEDGYAINFILDIYNLLKN